jgi:hypothetical protein
MTIHAQLSSPQPSGSGTEPATDGLPAAVAGPGRQLALLDPRTRRRSIRAEHAPPGRYLQIEAGEETRLIPLDRPILHIGRGLTSDLRLEDPQVSRRHAIIAQRGDGVRVLDDRSAHGTIVNGRRVDSVYLADGDVLTVGRAVFRFVEVASPVRSRPIRRRIPLPVRAPGGVLGGRA